MGSIHTACSGVILAGGLGRRFSGRNKAFLKIGQHRLIDNIYKVFCAVFEEIIIVTNQPAAYLDFDATIVTDVFPVRSSLTGIHAGLFYSGNPFIFAVACDIPFLQEDLVRLLLSRIEPGAGVVIPETGEGLEPLCAVYAKNCLPVVERRLEQQKFKIQRFFKSFRVLRVPEEILRTVDPELKSFFNINTPADLARAEAWLKGSAGV
mgnify:CR=1 FL=1